MVECGTTRLQIIQPESWIHKWCWLLSDFYKGGGNQTFLLLKECSLSVGMEWTRTPHADNNLTIVEAQPCIWMLLLFPHKIFCVNVIAQQNFCSKYTFWWFHSTSCHLSFVCTLSFVIWLLQNQIIELLWQICMFWKSSQEGHVILANMILGVLGYDSRWSFPFFFHPLRLLLKLFED